MATDASIRNYVKYEEMEIIMRTVGTFGEDGASLEDLEGIQKKFVF